jgi:hypothetical protein
MNTVKYLFASKRFLRFFPFVSLVAIVAISYAGSSGVSIILSSFYVYGPSRAISGTYFILLLLASLLVMMDSTKEIKWLVTAISLVSGYLIFHIEYSLFLQIVMQRPEIIALPFVRVSPFFSVFWSVLLLCICLSLMGCLGMEKRQFSLLNILTLLLAASSAFNSYWSWLGIKEYI